MHHGVISMEEKSNICPADAWWIFNYNVRSLMDMAKSCVKKRFNDLGLGDKGYRIEEYASETDIVIIIKSLDKKHANCPLLSVSAARLGETWMITLHGTILNDEDQKPIVKLLHKKSFCGNRVLNVLLHEAERYGRISQDSKCVAAICGIEFESIRELKENYCSAGPDEHSGVWHCGNFQKEVHRIEWMISHWEPVDVDKLPVTY